MTLIESSFLFLIFIMLSICNLIKHHEIENLKDEIDIVNRICKKVANMCVDRLDRLNRPTYGPMLEDDE